MIYSLSVPGTIEGMEKVRVLEWHGAPGDHFEPGDLIVELETHKAVIEVRAEQPGVLRERLYDEGAWCPLDTVFAVLSDEVADPLPATQSDLVAMAARFSIG